MHKAKTTLPQLVTRAAVGEEIVITRHGKPTVMLTPVRPNQSMASVRGIWRDQVRIADDFDGLPADLAEAFGAK